jgi:Tfp pilus assembly protein PilX
MSRLDPRRARESGEEGLAMIMVIGTMVVMTALVAVALTVAMNYAPVARKDQDWNAALAAAQAGVDDYLAKLNQTDTYWTTVDCTNVALKGPNAPATNTCGWTSSTPVGWQTVHTGLANSGQFHYDVDTSGIWKDGSVRLTSTGKVNGVTRTIQVRVSKGGSTDFLYYTDYEDADPANTVPYPGGADAKCGGSSDPSDWKYWWQGRTDSRGNNLCSEITFIGGDVLDGKAHFNDSPLMTSRGGEAPKFLQGYETADPNCTIAAGTAGSDGYGKNAGDGKCWRSTSNTNPYVGTSGATPAPLLYLTDTSDQFKNFPGCVYTGDTRIRFKNDGTMDVWTTRPVGLGPDTPAGTNCGSASSTDSYGRPTSKVNVPVPNDMVIYVKNSGTSSACIPGQVVNGPSSGSISGDVIPQGTGTSATGVTDANYFDPDKLVTTTKSVYTRSSTSSNWAGPTTTVSDSATGEAHNASYDCGQGNVYIEGTVKGRVTVAAQNDILVTDDLLIDSAAKGAAPAGTDMVGLVASNSVVVYHPVARKVTRNYPTTSGPTRTRSGGSDGSPSTSCPSTLPGGSLGNTGKSTGTLTCTWTETTQWDNSYSNLSFPGQTASSGNGNRYIYASLQTLSHSFTVQHYDLGDNLGKLSVRGSIAQKWRGAVGTGSNTTGYLKDYSYDQRLVFASPPYFPAWTNAVWAAKTTGELTPQYGG